MLADPPSRQSTLTDAQSAAIRSRGVVRAAAILIAGYLIGYFTPDYDPTHWHVMYPLAIPVAGALAALQFHRPGFWVTILFALLGALAFAWFAACCLPVPGINMAFRPFEFYALLFFVPSAIVGALVGLTYGGVLLLLTKPDHTNRRSDGSLTFSLRGLFIAITIFAFAAYRMRQFHHECQLADAWESVGLSLTFDYWGRPKAAWAVPGTTFDDAALDQLTALQDLRALALELTQVTDAGLVQIKRFPRLRYLSAGATPITDIGLQELASMHSLGHVDLYGTNVTSSGITAFAALHPQTTIRAQNHIAPQVSDNEPPFPY